MSSSICYSPIPYQVKYRNSGAPHLNNKIIHVCSSHHSHFGLSKIYIWLYPQQVKPLVVSHCFYDKDQIFNKRHEMLYSAFFQTLNFLSFFSHHSDLCLLALVKISCCWDTKCSLLLCASLGLKSLTQPLPSSKQLLFIPQNLVAQSSLSHGKILSPVGQIPLANIYSLRSHLQFWVIIWLLKFSFARLSASWKQRLCLFSLPMSLPSTVSGPQLCLGMCWRSEGNNTHMPLLPATTCRTLVLQRLMLID